MASPFPFYRLFRQNNSQHNSRCFYKGCDALLEAVTKLIPLGGLLQYKRGIFNIDSIRPII